MTNPTHDFSGERYKDAYIGVNTVPGGNRTGYPCAADAFAIVVKGLPWKNGEGNERLLEVGHEQLETKLQNWSQDTGLPLQKL